MKITTIIQARMTSFRLPRKVKKDISGFPLLWHVWQRAKRIKPVNQLVIATGVERKNEWIRNFCRKYEIDCYSGHNTDVLDRYYQTAKICRADIIIRITADCPLLDPDISSKVLENFLNTEADYGGLTGRFPDTLSTEVFTFKALKKAAREAKHPYEREHVTLYLKNSAKFKVQRTKYPHNHKLKLSVDRIEDLKLARKIFNALFKPKKKWFGIEKVIKYLKNNPALLKINPTLAKKPKVQNSKNGFYA